MTSDNDRKQKGMDFNVELPPDAEELDAEKQAKIRRAHSMKYARVLSTTDGAWLLDDMTNVFCGTSRSNNPDDLLLAEGARRAVEYMRNKKMHGNMMNSISGGA